MTERNEDRDRNRKKANEKRRKKIESSVVINIFSDTIHRPSVSLVNIDKENFIDY